MEAIKTDPDALRYIPQEMLSEELCLDVVKRNGHVLKYIPQHLQTEEMCIEALTNDFHALKYIHEHTENITNEAIKIFRSDPIKHVYDFKHLKFQPEDLCWLLINHDVECIMHIPNPTEEMCMFCIEKECNVLRYIKNKTDKICFKALEINCDTITYILKPTQEMHEYVLSQDPNYKYEANYAVAQYIELFRKNPNILKTM